MKSARSPRPPFSFALACLSAGALLTVPACDGGRRPAAKRPAAGVASQRDARGLFNSIRSQLRTLPERSQLELTPPVVVLDSRSSTDGEEIQGLLRRRPEAPNEPANLITVPRRNARFRSAVQPGDIVKYYGVPDRDTLDRLRETGDVDIATFESIDLVVAQVLGDDALLIVGGFAQEDVAPRKIEVWRIVDERMDEIQREMGAYFSRREPPLAWHPSPDEASLKQLTERLNQWLRQVGAAGKRADASQWKRPALLGALPASIAENEALAPYLADDELATGYFRLYESRLIQGATWRRDVARWARGSDAAPMAVAGSLFDWTVRNLQLVEPTQSPPRWQWELMLHGQATVAGRAWLFAGLCEQQNLTAVVVNTAGEAGEGGRLLVGVVDGDQLRMFDPAIGLPIPGAESGSIATLAELQADDSLLRQFDLDGQPYPVTAESLKSATAAVVIGSPFALSQRAGEFTRRLTGEDALTLAPDLDATADRLRGVAGIEGVTLWTEPFETLADKLAAKPSERQQAVRDFLPFAWRPMLWRGRLQQFRGVHEEAAVKRDALDETLDDHQAAQRYYMNRNVRPPDDRLSTVPEDKRDIYRSTRTLATLFLAELRLDDGADAVAIDWLENSALDDSSADPYRPLIQDLKARALARLGEKEKAADVLDSIEGPMAYGAKLLARQYREAATEEETTEEETTEEETTEEETTEEETTEEETTEEETTEEETTADDDAAGDEDEPTAGEP
ncbi:hypothetical protein Pla108_12420 [Botrimarina colliarenosi]|uniref:Uncharacterized protein n=1 Tax=Botrimarina colliarenosi TaxID=2528001 RepID=A0A5C6AJU4_9BACT|nr:hypothetical protein [Botrimarina colliarenosi]TWU00293.1 hypothetical protein Pla108_12420 [Botrimarina colliarenosi]